MTHIAIDLDDVVLDFCGNLIAVINREYDAGLDISHINQWDLTEILNPIIGEEWWEWWERRYWLWPKANAVPGAIGGLEDLRRQGHYLEIVTAKPRWAEPLTWQWLGKWQPPVNRVTIVDMTTAKSEATDAPVLIDDKPTTVVSWTESRPDRQALLFTRQHNLDEEFDHPRITRVENWKEIPVVLKDLERPRKGGIYVKEPEGA